MTMTEASRPCKEPLSVAVLLSSTSATPLARAVTAWEVQDYPKYMVRVATPGKLPWNISFVRNAAARSVCADLLVFAPDNLIPAVTFLTDIMREWDAYDVWVLAGVNRGVPCNPAAAELVAVKRWVNSRVRGFNEDMMTKPHGWGYATEDYLDRVMMFLRVSGGARGEFSTESVTVLPSDRNALMSFRDADESYRCHRAYSAQYCKDIGFVGNVGKSYGA